MESIISGFLRLWLNGCDNFKMKSITAFYLVNFSHLELVLEVILSIFTLPMLLKRNHNSRGQFQFSISNNDNQKVISIY